MSGTLSSSLVEQVTDLMDTSNGPVCAAADGLSVCFFFDGH